MKCFPHILSSGNGNPFELFFELSADLLCIAGFDGYFKQINPAVSKLLGYTKEELFSRPINDFVFDDDKKMTEMIRGDLINGNPVFNFENRYVTKSGEIVWLSWTSMNINTDRLVFAVAKDVTIKKRLEEERNRMLLNITLLNKELKQLTYTTSHDLKAPVNNLIALFELLDVSKITDEETHELIQILKVGSVNLQQTLNGYVDSLSERQSMHLLIEEVSLNETLISVKNTINLLIKNSGATIEADFSEVSVVRFNKPYLYSIFLNLLTNSIKYARPDGKPLITIFSEKINGISHLVVKDNGMGFDMEKVKDKIFGLHQKFHEHTDSKGVGLFLVYNHVVSLGGSITLDSKPGEGSTFTIAFKDERKQ